MSKPGGNVSRAHSYDIPEYLLRPQTAKAHDRKSLDAIEGEGTNYKSQNIVVRKPDGELVTALTYTIIAPSKDLKTSFEYVRYIIGGFREREIPQAYIDKVKAIATANDPTLAASLERL